MAAHKPLSKLISYSLLIAFTAAQISARPAFAGMVSTEQVMQANQASAGRERIKAFLNREDVRAQVRALGVDPEEAQVRVASLSDGEIAQINSRLEGLPAGGGFLGVVVSILVVIVLILLITDLLGYTDVFPFIRPLPRSASP
jgi:hypothetical protein